MRIAEQTSTIWGETPTDYEGSLKWIERAGRTCYNSSERMTDQSWEGFIGRLVSQNPPHTSVLEHSSVCASLNVSRLQPHSLLRLMKQLQSRWLQSEITEDDHLIVWGNIRAWLEKIKETHPVAVLNWLHRHGFQVIDAPMRETKRITVELFTDRAILAEITRHRNDVAFSVQSQRYVAYDGEVTFIKPSWAGDMSTGESLLFYDHCFRVEQTYKQFRAAGRKAQEARVCLGNQVATRIVMTAYLPQWWVMFGLRAEGGAYPQMINLMAPLRDEFVKRDWV